MIPNIYKGKFRLSENRFRIFAAVVLLLMFFIGLLVSADYSMSWDEPHEIRILQKNIRTIAETFLGSDSQIVYAYEELRLNSIATDIERDHGQAAYYPFALYLIQPQFLDGDYGYSSISIPYKFYTFAVCFTAIIAFYLLTAELFHDRRLALLCAVTLFVIPRFFAESHYNNKDMVLLALFMDTCYFGVRAIKRRRFGDTLLFALFAALAANTKIIGIFFFGVIGIFYLIYLTVKKQWDRRSLVIMFIAILAFCAFYYALTPAMWENPLRFFEYCFNNALHFSRWSGQVLFDGQIYTPANGELPRRYIPQLILLTTPIFICILAALGFCRALKAICCREKNRRDSFDKLFFILMICCCAFVPILVSIIRHSVLYNGWRHFYFSFAGVAVLMAYGMDLLRQRWPKLSSALLLLCVIFISVQNAANHPYQYVYYNVLAGDDILHNYELDYWTLSTREGTYYAVDNSSGDITLAAMDAGTAWSLPYSIEYLPEDIHRIKILTSVDESADYIIENPTYSLIDHAPPVPEGFYLEKTLSAYGEPILNIYGRR